MSRTCLTADITLYVSTAGSDTAGEGSAGNPWRTKQKASDYIQRNLDLAGFKAIVQSADGNYADPLAVMGPYVGAQGPQSVRFRGNTDTPYNKVVQSVAGANCFTGSYGAQFSIEGFRLQATGNGVQTGHGIVADGARIHFGIMDFAGVAGAHLDAGPHGMIQAGMGAWGYVISAGGNLHAIAETGGTVALNGITIVAQYTGIVFATAGFQVDETGQIILVGTNFAGHGFSGKKFNSISNGIIATGGQADNWIPGTIAGVRSLGGVYY